MSTTLELFWNLSSSNKKERLDASAKLIGALERFQAEFVPKNSPEASEDDEGNTGGNGKKSDGLDALNAQDVSYSIRRLVRGLASPRESSRLGFAVALTELLSRINTVTCSQVVALILDSSKTQGSMTGQEERDVLFARLFGLTAAIQSGLVVRTTPLSSSASSATEVSNLASFMEVISELLLLGEKRSWLRESAWWTIGLVIDALGASFVSWKDDAFRTVLDKLFSENKVWTPEKVALALKLQKLRPDADWRKLLSPPFKHPELVHTGNYTTLSRILKEVDVNEDGDADTDVKSKVSSWKPQVHYVWDNLLLEVLTESSKGSFPELFRILVDESLFSSTSSPQRKYWGFQIFQKALPRVSASDLPMLFTKNFMRSWINHLSSSDRYLHKAAKQVASDIQNLVKKNPTLGFALLLQLTGVHGSHQFDKLTRTKTVETILTSMDNEGIQSYIKHLLAQVNDRDGSEMSDVQAINARRTWVIEQLSALIRNGAIPKDDAWVQAVLDWLAVHGLFIVRKQSDKSEFLALHSIPTPTFSDDLRRLCKERLLSCLGELTNYTAVVKNDDVAIKVSAVASDGQFWVSKVLNTIERLEKDAKHVTRLTETDEEEEENRQKARELTTRLGKITSDQHEAAKGASLLVQATLLHQYCADEDDDSNEDALQSCIDGASRMFPAEKSKKSRKSTSTTEETEGTDAPEPIDVLVDTILGFLEKGTASMRSVANHVFSILSGSVRESTIDLIVAQLARKDPSELLQDEDDDMEGGSDGSDDDEEGNSDSESANDDEDEEEDMEDDPELRRKIEEALRVNGVDHATDDSDNDSEEELMDDDQMMAIDKQLAAVFKARSDEKRQNKGTAGVQREAVHYKNRVLDLVDIFLKKQPTSSHVVRLILPLTELIVDTSSDEKHLADKATGILRSRIGKSKEIPANVEKEEAMVILQEIHTRARKAPSSDILATLNQCSLFIVKLSLHQPDAETEVAKVYRESLTDFVTRKASRLNTSFLLDFIRRYAGVAWNLRTDLTDFSKQAVNGYRQTQVFQLLHTLVNQYFSLGGHNEEILTFMPSLHESLYDTLIGACDKGSLTAPQVKEVFKSALALVRLTRKIALGPDDLVQTWDRSSWENLTKQLASSESLKTATSLQNLCKQLIQVLDRPLTKTDCANGATKRKADESDHEADAATKKAKRKKVKKNKALS